jgi:sialic acid synthase SpsE
MMKQLKIGSRLVGAGTPTYFIADIAANHDGELERAKLLIQLAKHAGADAAKFQNFTAHKIVSDVGFKSLGGQLSHQSKWKKSVFEVYHDASVPHEWTPILKEECDRVGIDYFSSAYDFEAVDMLDPFVPAYKIGSGDIDWTEMLLHTARKGKPVLIATGAATMADVVRAVETLESMTDELILMQCNTNYTGSDANFDHIHLQVLRTYRAMFPEMILGLSDHTHGHTAVLGAVALGATVIEKHFTDDNDREGPDHTFAMNPESWVDMVARTRELERALGSSRKFIADNEKETVLTQRRCLRAAAAIPAGQTISRDMIDVVRPATADAIRPPEIEAAVGTKAAVDIGRGEALTWTMLVR